MRILLLFCLSILLFSGCKKKQEIKKPGPSFESLMGEDLPAWKHVLTQEDFKNLAFFKDIYEKNIPLLKQAKEEYKIPKVIHFIWIGPKAFPRESIENVRTWIGKNPDWKIKFWTDRARPLPHPYMQLCKIAEFPFRKLERFYHSSDNFAEKSDVLRYEILFNEGGVYVDHDVKCMQSFDAMHKAYDFYCGMEAPYATTLSSSVLPTNNIVGSKIGHPILEKSMDWLVANWDQIEKDYPGSDRDAVINRISHRTFLVMGKQFIEYHNLGGNVDIALPTYYFNSPKEELAILAQHQYKGTWFENESVFEKKVRKRLMMLSKKVNKLLLGIGILAGLNVLGFSLVAALLLRQAKSRSKKAFPGLDLS